MRKEIPRFICPKCGRSHDRGFVDGVSKFRCLNCGYVGPNGTAQKGVPEIIMASSTRHVYVEPLVRLRMLADRIPAVAGLVAQVEVGLLSVTEAALTAAEMAASEASSRDLHIKATPCVGSGPVVSVGKPGGRFWIEMTIGLMGVPETRTEG